MKNNLNTSKNIRLLVAGIFGIMLFLNIAIGIEFKDDSFFPSISLTELGNKAVAQGEGGSGDPIYIRETDDCTITVTGEYNARIKIFGVYYTIPASGSVTVTASDAQVICSANGSTMCTSKDCSSY